MPRTVIPIVTMTLNAGTASSIAVDTANDHYIAAGGNLDDMFLHVVETGGTAGTIAILPGDNPPAFRAGLGTATITVAANGTAFIPLESARFMQSDGTVEIDLSGFGAGRISCYRLPTDL